MRYAAAEAAASSTTINVDATAGPLPSGQSRQAPVSESKYSSSEMHVLQRGPPWAGAHAPDTLPPRHATEL
eukprot:7390961-Prymnesium_polylepis.1